ncbi:alpha-2A adrenergic receptor-like [Branchiostoma floridae]|uniref:Alpha-2A adrenergic receptor-like n=1 Tax=Branchiostoma floridae TaxID=7739 RepID=A0A9J7LB49_BRAFL|nr:alpha-2A adrenergic receptor-like [Branchiostoma floridae]
MMNATYCGLYDYDTGNASFNSTDLGPDVPRVCLALLPPEIPYSPIVTTLLVAIMSPVIFLIVVGNSLVIYACLTDSKLRRPHHWFLISLAVSDLTVGLLVMPFALVNEVRGSWPFGSVWCEIHVTVDVLACTASIYNLCAIALDRYWCSTRMNYARLQSSTRVGALILTVMNYARLQSSTRVGALILTVWVLALTVCLPPLMGWGEELGMGEGMCGLSSFFPYVVLSSTLSFFIPLVVMVTLYAMILNSHRSRKNWRRKLGKGPSCSTTVTNNTFKSRNMSAAEDGEMSPTRKEAPVSTDEDSATPKSSPNDCRTVAARPADGRRSSAEDADPEAAERETEFSGARFLALNGTVRHGAPARRIERSASGPLSPLSIRLDAAGIEAPQTSPMRRRRKAGQPPLQAPPLNLLLCPALLTAKWHARTPQPAGGIPQLDMPSFRNLVQVGSPMRQCAAQRRERRFVFIIGVVMVTFTLCWLPFFTFYLLCVLWWQCFPRWLFVLSVWLGYCNSALNPAIYAIWNDAIREAFKNALCSKAPGHATP